MRTILVLMIAMGLSDAQSADATSEVSTPAAPAAPVTSCDEPLSPELAVALSSPAVLKQLHRQLESRARLTSITPGTAADELVFHFDRAPTFTARVAQQEASVVGAR